MRLKDTDKLIELIDDDIASLDFMNMAMSREGYDVCLCTLRMVKQYIKALPTIDAEPVVRCKDCKYFYSEACEIWEVDEDDYCSRGERKGGGENED